MFPALDDSGRAGWRAALPDGSEQYGTSASFDEARHDVRAVAQLGTRLKDVVAQIPGEREHVPSPFLPDFENAKLLGYVSTKRKLADGSLDEDGAHQTAVAELAAGKAANALLPSTAGAEYQQHAREQARHKGRAAGITQAIAEHHESERHKNEVANQDLVVAQSQRASLDSPGEQTSGTGRPRSDGARR